MTMGADVPKPQPWRIDAEAVGVAFETSMIAGLDDEVAAARLVEIGANELVETRKRPSWKLLADQFASPMILVLIAAAVVTAAIGHFKDTAIILAIVLADHAIIHPLRAPPRAPLRE